MIRWTLLFIIECVNFDYYLILISSKSLQCATLHWVRHGRSHVCGNIIIWHSHRKPWKNNLESWKKNLKSRMLKGWIFTCRATMIELYNVSDLRVYLTHTLIGYVCWIISGSHYASIKMERHRVYVWIQRYYAVRIFFMIRYFTDIDILAVGAIPSLRLPHPPHWKRGQHSRIPIGFVQGTFSICDFWQNTISFFL